VAPTVNQSTMNTLNTEFLSVLRLHSQIAEKLLEVQVQ